MPTSRLTPTPELPEPELIPRARRVCDRALCLAIASLQRVQRARTRKVDADYALYSSRWRVRAAAALLVGAPLLDDVPVPSLAPGSGRGRPGAHLPLSAVSPGVMAHLVQRATPASSHGRAAVRPVAEPHGEVIAS